MASNKPQFNVLLPEDVRASIDAYCQRTGIPRGKLVEQLWNFYNLGDLGTLRNKLTIALSEPLQASKRAPLYQIYLELQRFFENLKES